VFGFEGCPAELFGFPGEEKTIDFYATLTTSNNPGQEGAMGWSFSLKAEGLKITEIGTRDIIVPGEPGFQKSQTTAGMDNDGAISAILLSIDRIESLPPRGTRRLARIKAIAQIPLDGKPATATLGYRDGLVGAGQPVPNVVIFGNPTGGLSNRPAHTHVPALGTCAIQLTPLNGGKQLPGDCNQDGGLDISDAVCLLGHLFLGDPAEVPCDGGTASDPGNKALLDANGDDNADLSDAVTVLEFLFLGKAPPVLGTSCVPIQGCPDLSGKCKP
jgi:hypothetical protein